ncbi:MAG: DUF2147 domain-containing protein [Bacteroidota bacterium]
MKKLLILFLLPFTTLVALSQPIVGRWKTIDDDSGEARSVVEIFERDGLYHGKIVKLYLAPEEDPDPVCTACEDHRKGQKIIGMEIISHMKYDQRNEVYHKGEIVDPENGNVYDCKLWIDNNSGNLKVRGYLLFFYRTQTWLPYEGD